MVCPASLPSRYEGRGCYTVRPARLGPLSRPVIESLGGESALPELSGLFAVRIRRGAARLLRVISGHGCWRRGGGSGLCGCDVMEAGVD